MPRSRAWAESGSAHMPIRLRPTEAGIEGEIGHRAYRFRPAPGGDAAAFDGTWRNTRHHAQLDIATTAGTTRIGVGIGPSRTEDALTPLSPTLALFTRGGPEAPSRARVAIAREADGLRLIGNRARVLRFS